MRNSYMTDDQRVAHFIPIILSEIRRGHLSDASEFQKIIDNDIVIPELADNYGYYHMFGYSQVIDELSKKEPLLRH